MVDELDELVRRTELDDDETDDKLLGLSELRDDVE